MDSSRGSEKEQEEAFVKKYGSIKPKRNLIAKESKHFDSADWAMARNSAPEKQSAASEGEDKEHVADVKLKK